jgi:hypothetical protein
LAAEYVSGCSLLVAFAGTYLLVMPKALSSLRSGGHAERVYSSTGFPIPGHASPCSLFYFIYTPSFWR